METTAKDLSMEQAAALIAPHLKDDELPNLCIHQAIRLAAYPTLLHAAESALDSLLETLEMNPLGEQNYYTIADATVSTTRGVQIKAVDGKLIGQLVYRNLHKPTGEVTDPTGHTVTRVELSDATDGLSNPQQAHMKLSILFKSLTHA